MTIGQKVICNGYEGTIHEVLTGQLTGMVEVRLDSGIICTDAANVIPVATIATYNLTAGNGNHVRKATKVVLSDGREIKFLERLSRREVITQLENLLAMAIYYKTADESLLNEALEAVVNDSNFPKVSA